MPDEFTIDLVAVSVIAGVALLSAAVNAALHTRRLTMRYKDARLEAERRLLQSLDEALTDTAANRDVSPAESGTLKRLELLEARIELLEGRLPADSTLDKLASVNDAILATRLENLARSIDKLESSAMTPGRVTTIVFATIAALAAIVAVLPWILERLSGS